MGEVDPTVTSKGEHSAGKSPHDVFIKTERRIKRMPLFYKTCFSRDRTKHLERGGRLRELVGKVLHLGGSPVQKKILQQRGIRYRYRSFC